MIGPETEVRYLDLGTGESYKSSVADMFKYFAHLEEKLNDSLFQVKFDKSVKITDWNGWSNVIAIRKVATGQGHLGGLNWLTINAVDRFLNVTENELVPFYDKESSKVGFHGSIKYSFTLKNPTLCTESDYLRIRNLEIENGERIEFINPVVLDKTSGGWEWGYEIYTQSRTYNANDIHLFGGIDIPEDIVQQWDKRRLQL